MLQVEFEICTGAIEVVEMGVVWELERDASAHIRTWTPLGGANGILRMARTSIRVRYVDANLCIFGPLSHMSGGRFMRFSPCAHLSLHGVILRPNSRAHRIRIFQERTSDSSGLTRRTVSCRIRMVGD